MLVLSRERNETVLVGNDVRVTVLDIHIGEMAVRGGRARLGFQAPSEVSIKRDELFNRIQSKTSGRLDSAPCTPKPTIRGRLQPVPDADVRLRVQAPPELSIHCSRVSENASGHRRIVPPGPTESTSGDHDSSAGPPPARVIDCRVDDNILIGNQLLVTLIGVYRFVADRTPSQGNVGNFTKNGF